MRILLSVLCFSLLFMFSCSTSKKMIDEMVELKPSDSALVNEAVSQAQIKKYLGFLASDEMAGRNTPSRELHIAGQYIASEMQSFGVKKVPGHNTYFQNVPMVELVPPADGVIEIGDSSFMAGQEFIVLKGEGINEAAEFVYVNRGSEEDYAGMDVKGKFVVASCGFAGQDNPQSWFGAGAEKRIIAEKMGAIGLIELYASQQLPFNFVKNYFSRKRVALEPSEDDSDGLTHIWITTEGMAAIVGGLKEAPIRGNVNVDGFEWVPFMTRNVVGFLPGSDPLLKDEYVIYGAHYDHVGVGTPVEGDSIYNGARDNGVGTASVLALADHLSKHPTKRSALFIFFTGEEKGLLGSEYYAEHPLMPLNKAFYCFNSDNAGYNDTSLVTIFGLGKTTGGPLIEQAASTFGLKAIDDPAPEQNLFDRSDNVNFAKKGVPAPTFSMGFTSFDGDVLKYYHQPSDQPDNISYSYLEKFYKTYLYAARLIANSNEKLFWTAGDKYYDAGMELYDLK